MKKSELKQLIKECIRESVTRFQPSTKECPKCGGKLYYIDKENPAKMYGCFNCLETGLYFSKDAVENKLQEAIMGFIPSKVSPEQQSAMTELERQGYRFANWYAGEPDAEGESDVGVAVMIKKSGPSRLYKEVEPDGVINETAGNEIKENDQDDYEMRKWQSGINKFNKSNTGRFPCPTCKKENALSAWQKKQGYQCDACADSEEGVCETSTMQLKDILNEITISRTVTPADKAAGVTGYISTTVKCKGCAAPTKTLRINSDGKEVVACSAKCSDMVAMHQHL